MKDDLHINDLRNRVPHADASAPAGADGPAPADGVHASGPAPAATPPDPTREKASGRPGWVKAILALGAGFLTLHVVGLFVGLGVMTAGLASCVASCSDNPIGDSREDAAFIASLTTNNRDLETFDALRGSLEALHEQMARRGEEEGTGLLAVDELRAQVAAGSWPKDEGNALNPRVWVRIAELSQTWLEAETGERWVVEDFAYPFPDSGPIPVPAVRDENDRCITRLRCIEGEDEGLYVSVQYYRWAKEAYYTAEQLEEDRAEAEARAQLLERIRQTGLVGERACLLSEGDLLVWSTGADDALRDPERFVETANELAGMLGSYGYVALLEPDTPINVAHDTFSYDYPNVRPLEQMSFDKACEALLRGGRALRLDYASGDVLLKGCQTTEGEPMTTEDLTGTLAPGGQKFYRHVWRAPNEGSTFDETLAEVAAEALDVAPERLIVASEYSYEYDHDDALDVWLVVQAGTLPETPDAFCEAMDALRDALWEELPKHEGSRRSLYAHVFEIDNASLQDDEGVPCTFAELRARCTDDPQALDAMTPDLLLSYMISASQWPEDEEPHLTDCEPGDVEGSIARSRAWRYGSEGTNETE